MHRRLMDMDTLSKLYLGSEPAGVRVDDDQLLVTLTDRRTVSIPLQVVSQLQQADRLPAEAEVLILRHRSDPAV